MYQEGFTLIELLVVIAVISVLMAILMLARDQARKISCMSDMRQVGLAFMTYQNEYEKTPPNIGNCICLPVRTITRPGLPTNVVNRRRMSIMKAVS